MSKFYLSAILALGMMGALAPALADPVISNRYYEDNATKAGCSSRCRVNFSAVPAGGAVLITHVACEITLTLGDVLDAKLTIGTGSGNAVSVRQDTLVTSLSVTQGITKTFVAVGETLFLYKPGQHPQVVVSPTETDNMFVSCRIAGERPSPL
jgi:hypothetical protein